MIKEIRSPVFQQKEDMCLTASIKNILTELGERHNNNRIKSISIASINYVCGYKPGIGTASDEAVTNMRVYLSKTGYELMEDSGPKVMVSTLKNIIALDNASLPIVSLSSEYFKVQKGGYTVTEIPELDHVVIVEKVTDATITVFDPYEPFIKKSSRNALKKDISIVSFIRCWSEANPPNQIIFVEKKAKAQKLLSSYEKG